MARNRTNSPAIPFIFVHETDSFIVDNVPTPVPWHHIHFDTSDFEITSGTTEMRVKRGVATSGLYMIYVCLGAAKKTGNPIELALALYKNGVACECAEAHAIIGAASQHSDAVLITTVFLEVGDVVQVYVSVDAGTATTEDNTARFIISALPMQGWDNNLGGKDRIRGQVSR